MATKSRKVSRKKKVVSRDYLIVAKNNVAVIVSGATGETQTLNAADTAKVLELLKQRQKTGKELVALLKKRGFSVDDADIRFYQP
jgi:hypothetical protein